MFEKEAEEYVRKIRHDVINWGGTEPEERFYNEIKFKQAFLAGVEAGKSQAETDLAMVAYMQGGERYKLKWHNLQKNPKDLPEPYSTVLDENADKITYCGGDVWTVYSDYYERDIDAEPPKVWCEIPKFEE